MIDFALLGVISSADFQVVTHWLGSGLPVPIALLVLQLLVVVSYGAILIGWRGATVGMSVAKLIAVDRVSCRTLDWRRSWGRSVVAFALTGLAFDVVSVSGFKTSQAGIDGSIATAAFLLTLAGYATFFYCFDSGARLLFGHCEEDLATPYQLFAEALGHYVTHAFEAHWSELSRLVPALARESPTSRHPRPLTRTPNGSCSSQ